MEFCGRRPYFPMFFSTSRLRSLFTVALAPPFSFSSFFFERAFSLLPCSVLLYDLRRPPLSRREFTPIFPLIFLPILRFFFFGVFLRTLLFSNYLGSPIFADGLFRSLFHRPLLPFFVKRFLSASRNLRVFSSRYFR